ncbi:MAG: heparinase, partial [Planktomarina temperata]|nr:heparinase [Planktomarina temperata]
MARYSHQLSWIQQLRYRWLLRLAAWSKPKVGLIATPEPWTTGDFDRGLRILSGKIVFTGHMMDIGESSIWNHKPPSPLFGAELHGFLWLDDLATYGDARAMGTAQAWILDWIDGFGMGLGPGWSAEVTGRRLIRWINHSAFLLNGLSQSRRDKICQSMALQTRLLSTSWRHLPAGRGRFEALAGLICAAQSLAGMQSILPPALTALVKECQAQIDV